MKAALLAAAARVRRAVALLFAGRYRFVGLIVVAFLLVSMLTRIALALFNGDPAAFAPQRLLGWMALGFVFDFGVATFIALPFALLVWLTPDTRRSRWFFAPVALAWSVAALGAFVFVGASELVFWNEFGTRFNFIAVDYLIYTSEVIGNIRESYPMPLLLGATASVALLLIGLFVRPLWRATAASGSGWRQRTLRFVAFVLLALVSAFGLDDRWKDFTEHLPSAQLASNGWFEFVHAFRHNEIDYAQFYRTLPRERAAGVLRSRLGDGGARFVSGSPLVIERQVVATRPERRLNVVLISVESLSADFMTAFGDTKGLTPRLDALARDSLFFTHLYATGTRTVRGLEALTLSLPPTPGHSVVKRPNSGHLFSLGRVLAEHGYEPIYLYGGYSYFDNMRAFFSSNGYTVIDRSQLAGTEIHAENIWGVADEDLFTLSLRELDRRAERGQAFFAHIMTTSNHRPYTYPAGRVDIASGAGRDGAVKYTDWAIGDFIDRARKRPWFDNTLFVIVADHCASSRGKTDLPIDRFHIPLLVYAPAQVPAQRIEQVASQIDVAPTILGLLGFSYRSRFFGQDILGDGRTNPRALLANYQTVGYLKDDVLIELRPKGSYRIVEAESGKPLPLDDRTGPLLDQAVAYYEVASEAYQTGALKVDPLVRHATVAGDPSRRSLQ
jgi:phosphoglycerol transferase MdoB-like AlkP superfamily enzyme